jgi:hypothetical protein
MSVAKVTATMRSVYCNFMTRLAQGNSSTEASNASAYNDDIHGYNQTCSDPVTWNDTGYKRIERECVLKLKVVITILR